MIATPEHFALRSTMSRCGHIVAACICIRESGHSGPHGCACGGLIDDEGTVYQFPGSYTSNHFSPETIEAHVAGHPHPADWFSALDRILGPPYWGGE